MNLYDKASLILTPNAYKAGKIYALKPSDGSGDMSHSRAGGAYFRNAQGLWELASANVRRLNYPVGGGCPKWLDEPSKTNMVKYNLMANAYWYQYAGQYTPNAIQSPLNGVLAPLFSPTLSGLIMPEFGFVLANSTTYTISYFVKKLAATSVVIRCNQYGSIDQVVNSTINLNDNTVTSGDAKIKDEGNGWIRIELSFTSSATGTNYLQPTLAPSGTIYVMGGQCELGDKASSIIVTDSTDVTRLADQIPAFNVASFIANSGAFFIDLSSQAQGQSNGNLNFFLSTATDGLSGDGFWIRNDVISPDRLKIFKRVSGASSQIYQLLADRSKIAIAWDGITASIHVNGALVVPDFAFTATALNYFNLNPNVIQETGDIILFNTRPTVTELNALTTI